MSSPTQAPVGERSFRPVEGLSTSERLRLYVEAACQRMSTEEVLDLADHLHDLIRERRSRGMAKRARAFC
jgi:hypothetical protein